MTTATKHAALIYPSSSTDSERGIDIVTITDDEGENMLDWHPMPGEPAWTTEAATAALASLGYAPTGPFRWSEDLGGGFPGWNVEVDNA